MHPLKRDIVTHTITFANGDKPVKVTNADRADRLAKMYRSVGVRFTMTTGDVPICPTCKVRECSYAGDPESGDSWSTWCHECFGIHAAAPWCFHDDCSHTGRGRAEFTGEFDADGAALYLCAAKHFGPMTLVQHMAAHGVASGERDAHARLAGHAEWLVLCRLEADAIGGDVAAEHPAVRAYAQAYVAAALATLAGDHRATGYGS